MNKYLGVFVGMCIFLMTIIGVSADQQQLVFINDSFDVADSSVWEWGGDVSFGYLYAGYPNFVLRIYGDGGTNGNISSKNTYSLTATPSSYNYLNLSYWFNYNTKSKYQLFSFRDSNYNTGTEVTYNYTPVIITSGGVPYLYIETNENITEIGQVSEDVWQYIQLLLYSNGSAQMYLNETLLDNRNNVSYGIGSSWYITANVPYDSTGHVAYYNNLTLTNVYNSTGNLFLNFYDETNDSLITWTTTYIEVISNLINANYTTSNGQLTINLSIDEDTEIRYTPGNYTPRSYYINMNESETANLSLYSLLNTTGTYPIIINVLDENAREVEGARVQALRYFPNSSTAYKLVLMKETDQNGNAPVDLEALGPYYKFQVVYNGEIKLRDGPLQIYDTSWTYYISRTENLFDDYRKFLTISYFFEYLNETELVRLEWSDSESNIERVCLDLFQYVNYEETYISSNCSSSVAGVLYASVNDDNYSSYVAKATFRTNDGNRFIDVLTIVFDRTAQVFGKEGLFYGAFLFIGMVFLGLSAGPVVAMVLGLGVGVVLVAFTGLISMNWYAVSSLLVFFIILTVIIVRRRSQ